MIELFTESFKIANLPVTILLLVVILYWIINIVGIFDLDMLHADADTGGDADVHAETDSLLGKTFDFGDVPIAIIISFFVLILWMTTLLANYYLGNSSLIFALVLYIPGAVVAFLLTKTIAVPLNKVFKLLKAETEEDTSADFSGSVCLVQIEANEEVMGQGEVNRSGDPIRVNIKTYPGKQLAKGQTALLIEYFPERGYYLADPYENLK